MKLFAQRKRTTSASSRQHVYDEKLKRNARNSSSLQSQLSPVHLMKSMGSGALVLTQEQQEQLDEVYSERVVVTTPTKDASSPSYADLTTIASVSSSCEEFTAGSTQSGDSFVAIEESPWRKFGGGHAQQRQLEESFEDPYLKSRDDILLRRRQELHVRGEQPLQRRQEQTPPRFPLPQRQSARRTYHPDSQIHASPANGKSLGSFQFEPDWTETSNHSSSCSASAADEDKRNNNQNDDSASSSWLHTTIGTISPIRRQEQAHRLQDVSPSTSFSSSNITSKSTKNNNLPPPNRLFLSAIKPPVPQETDEVSIRSCLTEQSQYHHGSNDEQRRLAWQQVALYESTLHHLTENTNSNNASIPPFSLKRATVLLQLGAAYQMAEQLELALQSYTTAASLFRKQVQRRPLALATALYKVGVVCSQLLKQQRQQQQHYFDRARNCLTESLQYRLAELGPRHVDTIDTVHALAVLYLVKGDDYATATQYAWQVVYARQAVFGPHHPAVAVAAQTAGKCLFHAGAPLAQARYFYDLALEVYNAMGLPNENPAVASLLRQVKRLERVSACNSRSSSSRPTLNRARQPETPA